MAIVRSITFSGQNKTDTTNGKVRIEDGNGRMVISDGKKNRIIIGLLPDGTIGMVISKPDFDVQDLYS